MRRRQFLLGALSAATVIAAGPAAALPRPQVFSMPAPSLSGSTPGTSPLDAAIEAMASPSRLLGFPDNDRAPLVLASTGKSEPLRLTNVNTKESYDLDLFIDGQWNANALKICDWLMRDWRQNRVVECDRRIYAGLYVMQRYFGEGRRVNIHSGFRTPETNVILREQGYNPGVNSQHLRGTAVDFSIAGANVRHIAKVASVPGSGGVGCYVRMGFVHWDFRGKAARWGDSF